MIANAERKCQRTAEVTDENRAQPSTMCVCVRACADSLCLVIWQLVLIICSCDWLAVLLFIVFALLVPDMNLAEAQQFTLAL